MLHRRVNCSDGKGPMYLDDSDRMVRSKTYYRQAAPSHTKPSHTAFPYLNTQCMYLDNSDGMAHPLRYTRTQQVAFSSAKKAWNLACNFIFPGKHSNLDCSSATLRERTTSSPPSALARVCPINCLRNWCAVSAGYVIAPSGGDGVNALIVRDVWRVHVFYLYIFLAFAHWLAYAAGTWYVFVVMCVRILELACVFVRAFDPCLRACVFCAVRVCVRCACMHAWVCACVHAWVCACIRVRAC